MVASMIRARVCARRSRWVRRALGAESAAVTAITPSAVGADLSLIGRVTELPVAEVEELLSHIMRMAAALWALPRPTIAAIEGPAAGGGMALALACDIRVASPDAVPLAPFIHMGMVPDRGLSWLLPRLVGEGRALEILLTGRPVDANLARQLGLFTETSSDPLGAALDLAATFARRPPGAVRATRRLLREVAAGTLDAAIDREAQVQAAAVHGTEFARRLDPWRTTRRPD